MSVRQQRLVVVGGLTLAACAPFSAPIAPMLVDTATPLERGQLRVTGFGGGGGLGLDGSAGGGDVRLRIGVGGRQELGFEGLVARVDSGSNDGTQPRWIGTSLSYGMKLSYKLAPRDWFAVIAGVGAMSAATGESVGGDLGVVFSRPVGVFRPYAGLVATLAGPVGRPSDDAGGITAGFVLPGGVSLHVSRRVDVFAEVAWVQLWATGKQALPTMMVPYPPDQTASHGGPYGVVGVAFTFAP